ncbi:MAG: D-alanine--D-alanine ligase [Gammaproteobacteria bacterium]|nr:D-alanine--D-alanine ligase [Gammaproteobacteria bacterium]
MKDASQFGKVAVLMGGWSAERDISLLTGSAVLRALLAQGVDAHKIDPQEGFQRALLDGGFDRAFIALHGRGGEDGTVQGALEFLGIPYTGSGVLGSAICMDKVRCKQLFEAHGLQTPGYFLAASLADLEHIATRLGFPLAVKPAHEGSSIGLNKVDDFAALKEAYAVAVTLDSQVLVEQWIDGPEYTAAILGERVLPMIRIETPNLFYDYEAKYVSEDTRFHCPCGLPGDVEERLAEDCMTAFTAASARGWGRVDFMLDDTGAASFLEVNTVPGLTSHSLVPMAARQLGYGFDELAWRILETSLVENEPGGER